jgi:hypothetical protein
MAWGPRREDTKKTCRETRAGGATEEHVEEFEEIRRFLRPTILQQYQTKAFVLSWLGWCRPIEALISLPLALLPLSRHGGAPGVWEVVEAEVLLEHPEVNDGVDVLPTESTLRVHSSTEEPSGSCAAGGVAFALVEGSNPRLAEFLYHLLASGSQRG